MKLSFTTLGCPEWTLDQIRENAVAYGYHGVEIRTADDGNHISPDTSLKDAKAIAQKFKESGVPIFTLMAYCRFASTDPEVLEKQQVLMRKLLALAEAMGAKYVRFFGGKLPDGANREAVTEAAARALKPLAREAAQRGIKLAAETHDDWCNSQHLLRLASLIDESAGLGFVYDIFNCVNANLEPWETVYAALKPRIVYCHLKDGWFDAQKKIHYVQLGGGDLPLESILRRFKQDGFESYFSFEWEKKWIPELDPPERCFPQFVHKFNRLWNGL
jgi:sugar phosphate isomerase/epimerase